MAKKQKFYVVWEGVKPGIYTTWDEAKAQVMGFSTAKYKSFDTQAEAEKAFKSSFKNYIQYGKNKTDTTASAPVKKTGHQGIIQESLCVDAACSGNPGDMEYQGVYTKTRQRIFHQGVFKEGTNNIGEFLALVHALALLKKEGQLTLPIYSDSRTAIAWVRNKKVKTTLTQTPANKILFEMIERALYWLDTNTYKNPIYKWETEIWGEIPADFGRK
jgi:ribonuclease HI